MAQIYKQPTAAQFMDYRDAAIAKGISRSQMHEGSGVIAMALDAIKSGGRIKILPAIVTPSWGGKVCFVNNVPVQLDQEWSKAIDEGAPQTPSDFVVRQMGGQYPPSKSGISRVDFVLLNLAGGSYARALEWGQMYGLTHTTPRHVFGLAKHKPNLHKELGVGYAYVVSPEQRTFQGSALVCSVGFDDGAREASAHEVASIGHDYGWVAFLRE